MPVCDHYTSNSETSKTRTAFTFFRSFFSSDRPLLVGFLAVPRDPVLCIFSAHGRCDATGKIFPSGAVPCRPRGKPLGKAQRSAEAVHPTAARPPRALRAQTPKTPSCPTPCAFWLNGMFPFPLNYDTKLAPWQHARHSAAGGKMPFTRSIQLEGCVSVGLSSAVGSAGLDHKLANCCHCKRASFAVGWVEHGNPVSGALREPVQNIGKRSQGFDSVRNPPFPGRFAPRTLRTAATASSWRAYDQGGSAAGLEAKEGTAGGKGTFCIRKRGQYHFPFPLATTRQPALPTSRRRSGIRRAHGRLPRPSGSDWPGLLPGSGR